MRRAMQEEFTFTFTSALGKLHERSLLGAFSELDSYCVTQEVCF